MQIHAERNTIIKDRDRTDKVYIRQSVKKTSTNHQLNLLNLNKKLKFYSTFKTDCHKMDFLDPIKNTLHKKHINKFCLGNHNLRRNWKAPQDT